MGQRFSVQTGRYSTGAPGNLITPEQSDFGDFDGFAVTPADGADLPNGPCDAIYCTGSGNVNVNLVSQVAGTGALAGTAVLTSLAALSVTLCSATRILSTSTTATGIFALYRRG